MDASNGTQVFFDYPQNLDRGRDIVAMYKRHLNGARSVTDVALIIASSTQSLHPDWGFPPYLTGLGDSMRAVFDYEVVDEAMLAEGALNRLGTRLAVLSDAEYMEAGALGALERWVRSGGVLVVVHCDAIRDIGGSDAVWTRLVPAELPEAELAGADIGKRCSKRVGKGAVLRLPGPAAHQAGHARAIASVHDHLPELVPGAKAAGPRVDTGDSGLLASVFKDRILVYNGTDKRVQGTLHLAGGGWGTVVGAPPSKSITIDIEPNTIAAIDLSPERAVSSTQPR